MSISMKSYSATRNKQCSGVRPFDGSAPVDKETYKLPDKKSYFSQKNRHEEMKEAEMSGAESSDEEDQPQNVGFNLKPSKQFKQQ